MLAASPSRAEVSTGVKNFAVRVDPRTKRLVRVDLATRPPAPLQPRYFPKERQELAPLVEQAAKANHVDPLLVDSVIQVESNYNPHAVSSKGAQGLMQLMPATARMLGVSNPFDPRENIEAGVRYLKQLKDKFGDDRLALAAYNAGPNAVDKYKGIPPYTETQNYVSEIGRRYEAAPAKTAQVPAAAAAAPMAVAKVDTLEEKPVKLEQFVDQNGRLHLSMAKQ